MVSSRGFEHAAAIAFRTAIGIEIGWRGVIFDGAACEHTSEIRGQEQRHANGKQSECHRGDHFSDFLGKNQSGIPEQEVRVAATDKAHDDAGDLT